MVAAMTELIGCSLLLILGYTLVKAMGLLWIKPRRKEKK